VPPAGWFIVGRRLITVALHFGTRDIALILARITRGLQLAGALKARLVSRPERQDAASAVFRAPVDRKPRAARPAAPRVPTFPRTRRSPPRTVTVRLPP